VGFVFILNGLHALNLVGTKEAGAWNFIISLLMFLWVGRLISTNLLGNATLWFAAQVLLFAFTYCGLGVNYTFNLDARGLGWYCLWVSIITPYVAYQNLQAGDWRFCIIWVIWGVLWFIFWLVLGLGKIGIMRVVKYAMVPVGFFTAWVPAVLMMLGRW